MNRTLPGSKHIHGTDPQNLMEKIIRERIYDSLYWKEECFGLTAELLVEKAVNLKYVGGIYGGNQRPCPFLCLLLKLLQLQPDISIVHAYISAYEYKYLRVLGAIYLRLVGSPKEIYSTLEPILSDYRKLCHRDIASFELIHVDEFIDSLLTQDRVCNVIMPRITKRSHLEIIDGFPPRRSPLEDELEQ